MSKVIITVMLPSGLELSSVPIDSTVEHEERYLTELLRQGMSVAFYMGPNRGRMLVASETARACLWYVHEVAPVDDGERAPPARAIKDFEKH